MSEPKGAILAGGQALRFGGKPKGLEEIGGVRMLDRLVAAMTEAFGTLPFLIANAPDASDWHPGLRVRPDRIAGAGTLGGIHAAILAAEGPVVCVAWDMPFVPAGLLRLIGSRLTGFDAVLPASPGPRGMEPLCAGYGPGCTGPIEAAIARQDLRAVGFHPDIRLDLLDPAATRPFGDPARLFFNVNTPEDLARANQAGPA
ncbi:MAG: molybdenum cofactor guanylyltransferase [Gemmatimonadetes bacterium]|nr:molybdenum cofactor guanylyltransferase [Gemmatimonadota bacterium]